MKNTEKNKKMSRTKKVLLSLIVIIVIAILCFGAYEIATVNNTYYIREKNLQIPIFVYHDIVEKESDIKFDYMQTTKDTFEKQILGLIKLGYKPISYKDLVEYKNSNKAIPKWSFLITFDDGYLGVYKYAFEIAKKYNIPMAAFAIDENVRFPECFSWEQAKEMNDSGMISIYTHGLTHIDYSKETSEKLVSQTEVAYINLRKQLQREDILKVFTYPYGSHTEEERVALWNNGFIQNLTDNKINISNKLDLSGLHREYPLSDSVLKIILKTQYRSLRYGG